MVKKKFPEVKVTNSAGGYMVDVAVYRHSLSPEEISVHIQQVYPIQPPPGRSDDVGARLRAGESKTFEPKLYPPDTEVATRKGKT